jgi:hypothetical protein
MTYEGMELSHQVQDSLPKHIERREMPPHVDFGQIAQNAIETSLFFI